jgi:hypothetical protein
VFLRQAVDKMEFAQSQPAAVEAARQVRYGCMLRNLKIRAREFTEAEQITLFNSPGLLETWQMQSVGNLKSRSGDPIGAQQLFLRAFKAAERESGLNFSKEHWVQTTNITTTRSRPQAGVVALISGGQPFPQLFEGPGISIPSAPP